MMQEELIHEFLEKQTAPWLEEDVPIMQEKFPVKQGEITERLRDSISKLCQEASQQQAAGDKGPAAYLAISFLRTNILDDCFSYRLDLYDEKFYLDRTECTGYFEMDFVWQYYQARLEQLTTAICSSLYKHKIRTRQMNAVKIVMAERYHQIAMICMQLVIEEALKTPEFYALRKAANFKVIIGEYKDKSMLLYEESSGSNQL